MPRRWRIVIGNATTKASRFTLENKTLTASLYSVVPTPVRLTIGLMVIPSDLPAPIVIRAGTRVTADFGSEGVPECVFYLAAEQAPCHWAEEIVA